MTPAGDEVRLFRQDPTKLAEAQRGAAKRLRITMAIVAAAGCGVSVALALRSPARDPYTLFGGPAVALIFLTIMFFRASSAMRKQLETFWASYSLAVTQNAMRYADGLTMPVEIVRSEVVRISEQPDLGLTVATAKAGRFLFLPETLEDYASLREHLSSWRAIEAVEPWTMRWGRLGWSPVQVLLTFVCWGAPDLRLSAVLAAGAIVAGFLAIRQVRAIEALAEEHKAAIVRFTALMILSAVFRLVSGVGFPMINAPEGSPHVAP